MGAQNVPIHQGASQSQHQGGAAVNPFIHGHLQGLIPCPLPRFGKESHSPFAVAIEGAPAHPVEVPRRLNDMGQRLKKQFPIHYILQRKNRGETRAPRHVCHQASRLVGQHAEGVRLENLCVGPLVGDEDGLVILEVPFTRAGHHDT